MRNPATIVGLGEILWDVFPDGARFGGAPANFACTAAALLSGRARVWMAGAVGRDELGRRAVESLEAHGVDVSCVAALEQSTGQVLVTVDPAGHASYDFAADAAWDNLPWTPEFEQLAGRTDIVCFGTLAQRSGRSRDTVRRFVSATPATALRVFDINLRPPFFDDAIILESLALASLVKLNDDELSVLAALCDLRGSAVGMLEQLSRRFDLRLAALTRGPRGAILVRGGEVSEHAGVPVDVVDTVGAGDAFTAALAAGLLDGRDLAAINDHACRLAAFVCSQPGATPGIPRELVDV